MRRFLLGVLLLALALIATSSCSAIVGAPDYSFVDKENCRSSLVDLQTDDANCGGCGNQCPRGARCSAGACACPARQTTCKVGSGEVGTCVDLSSDAEHCGSCSKACPSSTSCTSGVCTCRSGGTLCGESCYDVDSDEGHCGNCQTACAAGATCTRGKCACPASSPTVCGDECTDLRSDAYNCAGCGKVCDPGHTNGGCSASKCTMPTACDSGYADCNGDLSQGINGDGCEVATSTNKLNCGGCNRICPDSYTCQSGNCVERTRFVACQGACTKDSDCADSNTYCALNTKLGSVCSPVQCQACFSQNGTCSYYKATCTYDSCN